ncbi:poly A polymerase C-terminal region-like protein [Microthyrium microscopicum]|uniref:Poly A polymerase C-terminal region-like protein n=1 Tax=Microthyrium microscopicum TaxID=703497 RepID=A0A6A6U1P6_9PEZI|nr:poly A polymerase C-terminal region-like protein [Microthyrium microscopicum]
MASIVLDEVEKTFRTLLLDVVKFIEETPNIESSNVSLPEKLAKAPLTIRWTGGWVRDKLIHVPSKDIDVAINKMTGYQFAMCIKNFLELPHVSEKYGKKPLKLHKIEANPDKSKHLETTTIRLFDLDIDFVNLRKETYTEESRNPQVEFGTPEEDALRRDATINAMFYNIHTSSVEDFTNRGLEDLKNGIIRTPLDPRTTFLDDPLRVLRLIRFATRYGYEIDEDSRKSMASKDIKKALMAKITRERVWTELEKMLRGPDPKAALKYVHDLGLYEVVFVDPSNPDFYHPDLVNWSTVYSLVDEIIHETSISTQTIKAIAVHDKESEFIAWMIASLVPWTDAPEAPPLKSGRAAPPMIATVAKEGLKTTSKLWDLYTLSVQHMEAIRTFKSKSSLARDSLGMAIRKWGPTWTQQVLFSMVHEVMEEPDKKMGILKAYSEFLNKCKAMNLLEAYSFKPLLDGKQLAAALSTKPGVWMKTALDVVMAWQLRNPENTDKDAVLEQVRTWKETYQPEPEPPKKKQKKQGELTSDLTTHFLRLTLRPLFSQTPRPHDLTEAGRRNINASVLRKDISGVFDEDIRPWKTKDSWALDLLLWVCKSLDHECVEREWGVLIPPVLTVLDDTDVEIKTRGCQLLQNLLLNTPSDLLKRTGLVPVFEESLLSCTSYLPTLTPEKESITILNAAFPALIALADAAYPISPEQTHSPPKVKFLLKVLRQAFFAGYKHAGENIRVAETLLINLVPLLRALGIDSVIHLKDLVPILSDLLDDPFGPASPALMTAGLKASAELIQVARPRIGYYRGSILKGLTGLWLRLDEDKGLEQSETDSLRERLRDVFAALDDAVKSENEWNKDWAKERKSLTDADERLSKLFAS